MRSTDRDHPVSSVPPPDLQAIMMSIVQALMDQGWTAPEIAADLKRTAAILDLMQKTCGVPQ